MKPRQFLAALWLIIAALDSYGGDIEQGEHTACKFKIEMGKKPEEALKSLHKLASYVGHNNALSNEEKAELKAHRDIVLDFDPSIDCSFLDASSVCTHEGTCCTWNEHPYIDGGCWARKIISAVNVDSRECLYCSCMTCCIFPVLFATSLTLAVVAQGCAYVFYLPFRPCARCDEYDDSVHINNKNLQTFIERAATHLRKTVNEAAFSKADKELLDKFVAVGVLNQD